MWEKYYLSVLRVLLEQPDKERKSNEEATNAWTSFF